ncbi:MAG: hypothetical protein U0T73_02515 [Chitinophagales bacterium]
MKSYVTVLTFLCTSLVHSQNVFQTNVGNAQRTYESADFGKVGIGTTNFFADLRVHGALTKMAPDGYRAVIEIDNQYGSFNVGDESYSGFLSNSLLVSRSNSDDPEDPSFHYKSYDFVVKGNGCTGIGFNDPTAQLHVRGVTAEWLKSEIPHELFLVDMGNRERTVLVATKDNRVGINKFNPTYELDILGKTRVSEDLYVGGAVGIGTETPNNKLQVIGSGNFTENLFIVGSVGIGTNSPQAKLDVSGDVRINKNEFYLREGNDQFHGLGWYGTGKPFASQTPDGPVLYGFAGGALGTRYLGVDLCVLSWSHDGKVKIGEVSTPGDYRLYVDKGIMAESFRCAIKTTSDWQDKVFDNNYNLPSLDYVERFISLNRHLPAVPSAQDVVKNGIDLGNISATLLAKIEELTLYIIMQQHEIEELKCK